MIRSIGLLGLFLISQSVFAAATFTMELEVYNPGAAVSGVVAKFNFPDCLTPKSFGSGVSWDSSSRTLTVQIGNLGQNETKIIPVEVESSSEGCSASGLITGEWFVESSGSGGAGGTSEPIPTPTPEPEPGEEEEITEPEEEKLTPEEEAEQEAEERAEMEEELGFTSESAPSSGSVFGGGGGGYVSISFLPVPVEDVVKELRATPEVVSTMEAIVAPITTAVEVASVGVVAVNAVGAAPQVFLSWVNYARFFLLGFVRRKKQLPWGRIYNESTRQPVAGAAVAIIDVLFQKTKERQITDSDGRFGFLITPGKYYLKIEKGGFTAKETQPFDVGDNPSQLNLEIGISEMGGLLTEARTLALRVYHWINNFLYRVNPLVLAIGTGVSLIGFLIIPNKFNLAVLILYGILDVAKIILSIKTLRSFGLVRDKMTGKPVSLAVVRLFNVDSNWMIGTRVSDNSGRYSFLLAPGRYYLTCAKYQYKEYKSGILEVQKKGIVTQTIEVEPIQNYAG